MIPSFFACVKNNAIVYAAVLFVPLTWAGCSKDFVEGDLSGKTVVILAPADNDTVNTSTPLFWWEEISDARTYRLQIVQPDFTAPQQILYDTAITGDRFYASLQPGTYTWRLRPENGYTQGDYVTRTLTIDSSSGLSNQQIVFTTPAANPYYTNNTAMTFGWNAVSGASFYRVDVIDSSDQSVEVSTTSLINAFNYTFPAGTYRIQVRAENSTSFSAYTSRVFVIDTQAPTASVPQSPANNAIAQPALINFTWIGQSSDRLGDTLLVSTDSSFVNNVQRFYTTATSYTGFNTSSNTTYYWKLRTRDAAGNWSGYSTRFKFITQ